MTFKAVFLDRDGTLLDDPGYLADPAGVKLLPGVDLALKSLQQAGFKLIVVTNQSGVARGMFTEETLGAIHTEMRRQLSQKGVELDGVYYCPFHPDGTVDEYARESDERKPHPGMLLKAAEEIHIDLGASWMVGDKPDDVSAGDRAGCRTIRIRPSEAAAMHDDVEQDDAQPDFTVRNLVEAVRRILHAAQAVQDQPGDRDARDALAGIAVPGAIVEEEESAEEPAEPRRPHFSLRPPAIEKAAPAEPAGEDEDDEDEADAHLTRKEILRYVRQMSMRAEHEEFSLLNLLGGVAQMLTILFLFLVLYKALANSDMAAATLWALVGVIFQVMSLTFFTMSRKR